MIRRVFNKIKNKQERLRERILRNMPARRKHIDNVSYLINDLRNAIVDSNGLGRLYLMLQNAHVPIQHYDIFIKMFANNTSFANKIGGGVE